MQRKRFLILFATLSVLVAGFILSQSLLPQEDSAEQSGWVMKLIKPFLDPENQVPEDTFHLWIRKTAHFVGFAALGLCVGGFCVNLGYLRQRRYTALPMLLTLLTAVADEFLQYFTGRGSMVTDVVLDYSGALFGLALAALIACLIDRRKNQ